MQREEIENNQLLVLQSGSVHSKRWTFIVTNVACNETCINILFVLRYLTLRIPSLFYDVRYRGGEYHPPPPRFLPQTANNIACNTSLERSLNILSM